MPEFPAYPDATALADADTWLVLKSGGVTEELTGLVAKTYFGGGDAAIYVAGLVENDTAAATANRVAIQTALDAAAAYGVVHGPLSAYQAGNNEGGARVVIPPGVYHINRSATTGETTACLWVGNATTLSGHGMGTRLMLAPGTVTLAAPCTGIKIRGTTNWCVVENLAYDGGWESPETLVDTNRASHGVDFSRSGVADFYDGGLSCRNCMFFGCQGDGLMAAAATNTLRAWNVYSYHNAGAGFNLRTDQSLWGCKAGNNYFYGYYVLFGSNVLLSGCKSFGTLIGADFSINYSESIQLDNCQSEDYKGEAGIKLAVVSGCKINAVVYRCMSTVSPSAALWVEDAGTAQVDPYHGERPRVNDINVVVFMVPPSGDLVYPKHSLITRNIGVGTQIRMTTLPGQWQTSRHNDFGTSSNGVISFNGTGVQGVQTIAYAATITPDVEMGEIVNVGALTGNLTVAAPTRSFRGQRLTFNFVQDATGTRTVTFNSVYKKAGGAFTASTGNGAVSNISFEAMADGNWHETSRSLALA